MLSWENRFLCSFASKHFVLNRSKLNTLKKRKKSSIGKNEIVLKFMEKLKEKYNLESFDDWNSITQNQIRVNGGGSLLQQFTMYELKSFGFPEGKLKFDKRIQQKPPGYWKNEQNILQFLYKLKEKYNLQTFDDWNSISVKQIQSNGGGRILQGYSINKLKSMGFPEGKSIFTSKLNQVKSKPSGYWNDKQNILNFLDEIKEKYNLQTPNDWNSITREKIRLSGGNSLLNKYSMFEIKCLACPEGESIFDKPIQSKPSGYWNNKQNILNFLAEVKEKYNLESIDDWNSITQKHILLSGGNRLLSKFSLFELKCLACPEGKLLFDKTIKYQPSGYWNDKKNVKLFLDKLKEKYNLQSIEDWNSITQKQIESIHGGNSLVCKYSMFELKCLACPEGESIFDKPIQSKPSGYWNNKQNILKFLEEIKEKYNLQSIDDWNSITHKQIQSNGGSTLLQHYSIFALKCMGCPEGKEMFDKPMQRNQQKPMEYWNNEENRNQFIEKLKTKFNLKTPQDWNRLSFTQIKLQGGYWLFYNNMEHLKKIKITFDTEDKNISFPLKELLDTNKQSKRSSQRWLFLQIQKLFPHEEIVEDYFHSEILRDTGFSVQFDIFLINKKIAIEYHGKQHYEDIPSGFSPVELLQHRDEEKEKLCSQYGIQLIIIPYWWDQKLDSLKESLYSKIKNEELKKLLKNNIIYRKDNK